MIRFKNLGFILLVLWVVQSCDGLKNTVKNLLETSERAQYERRFNGADSLMTAWKKEFSIAAASPLKISDGSSFTVKADPNDLKATGYLVKLQKGDLLSVDATSEGEGKRIFVDLWDVVSGPEEAQSEILKNNSFTHVTHNSGWYRIIIQPEIEYEGIFTVRIYTQPSLSFPVAGKGNKDIQSFWGAGRDNGDRKHEGIDIFAKRGTAVLAATDGYIMRAANSGLGGKQVWQRDGLTGNSLYYAHLDSILVESGARVKTGDPLGLVGSTGNAAGGPPHLHFGIYSAGGAVDPYPYVQKRGVPEFRKSDLPFLKWAKSANILRFGPGMQYETITTINEKISVRILAVHGEWIHIRTSSGDEGFVNSKRLQ